MRKERGGLTGLTSYGRSSIDRGDGGVANFKPSGVTTQQIEVEGLAMEVAQIEREGRSRQAHFKHLAVTASHLPLRISQAMGIGASHHVHHVYESAQFDPSVCRLRIGEDAGHFPSFVEY